MVKCYLQVRMENSGSAPRYQGLRWVHVLVLMEYSAGLKFTVQNKSRSDSINSENIQTRD